MYIKILVYIIDNQQIKLKISIPFLASWSFAGPVLWLRELGGLTLKTAARPGRFRGGGPSRISRISPQSRIPLHVMRIPHIPTCPSSQHIPNFIIFAT